MNRHTLIARVIAALVPLSMLVGCVSFVDAPQQATYPTVERTLEAQHMDIASSIVAPGVTQIDANKTRQNTAPIIATATTDQSQSLATRRAEGGLLVCLSERQRLAQLIAVLLKPAELEQIKSVAARGEIGMISLLGKADSSIKQSIAAIKQVSPVPPIFASDEETAKVQRLSRAIYPLPSAKALLRMSTTTVRELYADYGEKMLDLGVEINFAPVVDIGRGPGIGSRSFGYDVDTVTRYSHAVAQGLLDAGVLPVFKHFPGHGSASADSHDSLPVTPSIHAMTDDLQPYRKLLHMQAGVMIGHLAVPGLSGDLPSSLSYDAITGLLKQSMGFDGIVFTDALNMGAIAEKFSTLEAALLAIDAGADVVMVSGAKNVSTLIDSLQQALHSGRLSSQRVDESAIKILGLKNPANGFCST